MDAKAPQMVMGMNLGVFKYPRGFIKVLEFVFSIFAFATTCGFSTHFSYTVPADLCSDRLKEESYKYSYGYPFRLGSIHPMVCAENNTLTGDFSSQSQYFVATGVLTFLFCIGIIILYVFFDQLYRSNVNLPIIDFGLTVVLAVLWLTSSAAWSQGVADLKYFSNPEHYKRWCGGLNKYPCLTDVYAGNFSTLNVSLIFGYLNFGLWACNLWFLFKETPWFLSRTGGPQPGIPPQQM